MSGDLKHPSKAIPKGTLYGLLLTFMLYAMVIFAMAASINRETFYKNTNVIQLVSFSSNENRNMHAGVIDACIQPVHPRNVVANVRQTNFSGIIILLGEVATSIFSVLMGVIGSAKLLQALARDHLVPGLKLFGQGTQKADEPIYAILITFLIAQVTMFADINQIASFITMTVSCHFFM